MFFIFEDEKVFYEYIEVGVGKMEEEFIGIKEGLMVRDSRFIFYFRGYELFILSKDYEGYLFLVMSNF